MLIVTVAIASAEQWQLKVGAFFANATESPSATFCDDALMDHGP
jgi:hypothetical protein